MMEGVRVQNESVLKLYSLGRASIEDKLFVCLFVCLFVYLFVCLSVCLLVCLFVN